MYTLWPMIYFDNTFHTYMYHEGYKLWINFAELIDFLVYEFNLWQTMLTFMPDNTTQNIFFFESRAWNNRQLWQPWLSSPYWWPCCPLVNVLRNNINRQWIYSFWLCPSSSSFQALWERESCSTGMPLVLPWAQLWHFSDNKINHNIYNLQWVL